MSGTVKLKLRLSEYESSRNKKVLLIMAILMFTYILHNFHKKPTVIPLFLQLLFTYQ